MTARCPLSACVCPDRLVALDNKQITFMFTDNHIVSEAFVEDINSLLSSGDITGLFGADEKERIFVEMRNVLAETVRAVRPEGPKALMRIQADACVP